jgi:hypothetical protein
MKDKPNTYYDMFIHLNRGILYFKTARHNEAIRSFVKFYTNEYYKKTDNLFKLRVAMAELIMQVESKDTESSKIRLEQIQKQFKVEMQQDDAHAEQRLFNWIKLLLKTNLNYRHKNVIAEGQLVSADKKMELTEDSQLLNYQAWVKKKIRA